jgi:rhodanese-related sulfurtransferase
MKKKNIIVAVLLSLLVGCATVNNNKVVVQKISCDNMKDFMKQDDSFLIDVRETSEYEEDHLEGAINISNTRMESITSYDNIHKDSIIIVYCKSGTRSKNSADKLVSMGYRKVYDLGSIENCK